MGDGHLNRIGANMVYLFLDRCAVNETETDYPEAIDREFLRAVSVVQKYLDVKWDLPIGKELS